MKEAVKLRKKYDVLARRVLFISENSSLRSSLTVRTSSQLLKINTLYHEMFKCVVSLSIFTSFAVFYFDEPGESKYKQRAEILGDPTHLRGLPRGLLIIEVLLAVNSHKRHGLEPAT